MPLATRFKSRQRRVHPILRSGKTWGAFIVLLFHGAIQAQANNSVTFDQFILTLDAFVKAEWDRTNNFSQIQSIQMNPSANKQELWGDTILDSPNFGIRNTWVWLAQPWFKVERELGHGFRLTATISQRWRGGTGVPSTADIPGFMYEENLAVSHDDYGRLAVGKMVSRGWSVADYPYGTQVGLADEWAQSGAGYGLLTKAIRYTTRPLHDGSLVLEGTYDEGNQAFKIHKPRFFEIYAQFQKEELGIDAIVQDTRNGNPQAWGQGPFTALTPSPGDDRIIDGASQGIAMIMARYRTSFRWQWSGGLRYNHWSGCDAVITVPGPPAQWNNMFNVNWNGSRNGVPNPGFPATSLDGFGACRYQGNSWATWLAAEVLGKARTSNPAERGQSNWANFDTAGVQYDLKKYLAAYGGIGYVSYGRLGLSPESMPTNNAFTSVDSRVSRCGSWFYVGILYVIKKDGK